MTIYHLLAVFLVVGLCMWLIDKYWPMPDPIKKLLNIAVVIILVLLLLSALGILNMLDTPVPRIR